MSESCSPPNSDVDGTERDVHAGEEVVPAHPDVRFAPDQVYRGITLEES